MRGELGRRRVLQALGLGFALPLLESLPARASNPKGAGPKRLVIVYVPNGAVPEFWWPKQSGVFADTLEPLAPHRSDITLVGGLMHAQAEPGEDGTGDHSRAGATYLTGVRARKTAGADIDLGPSIDQLIAAAIGHHTRIPSLELSCDGPRQTGECDGGYACAYRYNLSWRGPQSPMPAQTSARLAFERLFGAGPTGERQANFASRIQTQASVLDFVRRDVDRLRSHVSAGDRRHLEQYLTSVRELERRLGPARATPPPQVGEPPDVPRTHAEAIDQMGRLIALALQTDSTRMVTWQLSSEGDNRGFGEIGVPEGHHYLSHWGPDMDKKAKVARIDRFYAAAFARFLECLRNTLDKDGRSLLDSTAVLYGSGIGDGNLHTHRNLPTLLAGATAHGWRGGRELVLEETPMSNLLVSLAHYMGAKDVTQLGDSTGLVTL